MPGEHYKDYTAEGSVVLADSLARAAVAGKYRSALRDGRLVLISPYDPDAGFNVGNAMNIHRHCDGPPRCASEIGADRRLPRSTGASRIRGNGKTAADAERKTQVKDGCAAA